MNYKIVHRANRRYDVVGVLTGKMINQKPLTKKEAEEVLEFVGDSGDYPKMWG